MIKGAKLRLKAIAPRMAQKTLRELKYTQTKLILKILTINFEISKIIICLYFVSHFVLIKLDRSFVRGNKSAFAYVHKCAKPESDIQISYQTFVTFIFDSEIIMFYK